MTQTSGFQVGGTAPDYYERYNPPIMAPFIEVLIQRTATAPGDHVLDVACGTGFLTRRAAKVVGALGRVAGLDLNAGMIAKARGIAVPAGAAPTWHEGSALDLPFDDGEFQRVMCQQGIQFFPDLLKATAEMARVLAPGGRVSVSFWAPLEDQTYMAAQIDGLRLVLAAAAEPLAAAFALSPVAVAEAFESAALREVETEKVVATVTLPPMEEYAVGQLAALPLAQAFVALPPERQEAYVSGVREALDAYRMPDGSYSCTFASWVVSATK